MTTIEFDSTCVDRSTLRPAESFIAALTAALCHQSGAPGYAVVSKLRSVFAQLSLKAFKGIRVDSTPDTTVFLSHVLQAVFAKLGIAATTTKHLTFNGFGAIRSNDDATLRYGAFGSRDKYYCSSRIGIERAIIGMIELARREGVTLTREHFFETAKVEDGYESTKVPHLDPYPGIGALQKHVIDIEGGHSEIYDVGRFCNENGRKPWDVLMLHSPNPRYVFGDTEDIPFVPYNAFIPRPEFVDVLKEDYLVAVVDDPGLVVFFNNTISCDADGQYYCIAHGASTPRASGVAPCRELSLSIAFPSVPLNEVRRLLTLIRG